MPYQLDFMTPGTWPCWASCRKQMRQMPNLRMYARGRPQSPQRWCACTGNRGGRKDLAISDFLAN